MQENQVSSFRTHAADALGRAQKLPKGPSRNDLRQLAVTLFWLEGKGFPSKIENHLNEFSLTGDTAQERDA
jgi:hypothetical protein